MQDSLPEQISETKKKLSLQRWKDAENNYPEYIPTFPEEAVMEIPDEMQAYGESFLSFMQQIAVIIAMLAADLPRQATLRL